MNRDSHESYALDTFKPRELEILRLIAEGLTNEEIAKRLFIEVTTVRWHNRQIYSKLGVHHRTLAVAQARQLGLLDDPSSEDAAAGDTGAPGQTPSNLPAQTTSFVGREREIAKVQQFLTWTRLVTITGSGGIGKTRLALEAATAVRDHYPDGIWFVSLAAVTDPQRVAPAIASVFSLVETEGEGIETGLLKYLRSRHLLLVLDNFEHVMPAASLLKTILADSPNVTLLVTSREILRLSGEQEYPLPPLIIPENEVEYSLEELARLEAVRLFVERAQAVHADFRLTADAASAIMRICHRLDGLPLAIELAAARMKMFSPQQLLVRLESGFGVLAQGPRDAPARQRTLHATIDWSYHLLDDDEKRLFVRLSISPGGWSLDAFDAICVDGLAVDPFDALSSLLDKSLIQQASGDHTEPRFFMLATLREYALEHLNPEDATALYRRYCDWFTAFAEQAYSGLHSSTSLRWYENLLLEEDNLRAALTLSLTPPRYPTLGLQLAGALSEFWHTRGRYREGTTWLTRALDVASCAPSYARARALNGAGLMAWRQGHYEEMAAWCTEALTIGEQIGDDCIRGFALHYLGHFEQLRQDYPRAVAFMTEGYRLYTETCSDAWGRAQALNCLGDLQRQLGVYADAEALLNQALPLFRKMNHQRGTMTVLGNLGHVLCHLEQPGESAARLSEALGIAQQLNSDAHIVELLPGFAGFALTVGVVARSAQLLGAVHSLSPSIGIVLQPVEQTDFDLYLAQARDRLDQQTFAAAWEAGEKMSLQQVIKFAMQTIAIWSEANVP